MDILALDDWDLSIALLIFTPIEQNFWSQKVKFVLHLAQFGYIPSFAQPTSFGPPNLKSSGVL